MHNLPGINGLGFSDEEISECLKRNGLLSIELEFTKKCNLRCQYCYSSAGEPAENELSLAEIKRVIFQAKELGAKKIILIGGGEPLMYPRVIEIINYIDFSGLRQVLFTNGTFITKKIACLLFQKKVSVIIKYNSIDPEVQDVLAGIKGISKSMKRGLHNLLNAGYPDNSSMLGIQTVICRQNTEELIDMWTWARERGIIPYFEMLTYQGRAKENKNLFISSSKVKTVFKQLEVIDKERFGIIWHSKPTIAAFSCKRHLYSCLINSQGYVQPCTGVDMSVGNIRENSLKRILETSSVIGDLRNIYEKIKGPCKTCEYNCECYGCRGNTYQITGDYLASDPTCWLINNKAMNESSAYLCK